MGSETVPEIERAIGPLTRHEWEELSVWLDQYEHPLDVRMQADLEAGRLDHAIHNALQGEHSGRVRSL